MKCLKCNYDSRRNERMDGKCPKCSHPFAFEPQTDKITDAAFQSVIDDVSARGTLQYSPAQLYYAVSRRLGAKLRPGWELSSAIPLGVVFFVLSAWLVAGTLQSVPLFWLSGVLGVLIALSPLIQARTQRGRLRVSWSDFEGLLTKWRAANGDPKGLLPAESKRVKALSAAQRAELSQYSFDRLLVVERDSVAAMLIRNHFHFENNCAILSLQGYPGDETRGMVLAMAKQNPALKVFIAHDASLEGCAALASLRRKLWLPDPATSVTELGLRPSQVWALKKPVIERDPDGASVLAEDLEHLSPKERKWLEAGNVMSLEALAPAALMRALHQGFARAQMLATTREEVDGGVVVVGGDPIWSGAGSYDQFASDSFG